MTMLFNKNEDVVQQKRGCC